jgi:hypothetical protein
MKEQAKTIQILEAKQILNKALIENIEKHRNGQLSTPAFIWGIYTIC